MKKHRVRVGHKNTSVLKKIRDDFAASVKKLENENLTKSECEQLMKDIAYLTKGLYFRATDNKALEEIYKKIATLEKGKIDVNKTMQYSERFYWFIRRSAKYCPISAIIRSA